MKPECPVALEYLFPVMANCWVFTFCERRSHRKFGNIPLPQLSLNMMNKRFYFTHIGTIFTYDYSGKYITSFMVQNELLSVHHLGSPLIYTNEHSQIG